MSGALQALFQNWRSFTAPAADALVALYSGGNNSNGQLGLGDTTNRSSPNAIGSGTTWASIAAGKAHTSAVKTDGTLWSWGFPNHGQLGINIAHPEAGRSSPVQVGALTDWLSVSAGPYGDFSLAIKTNGTLWGWGRNSAAAGAPLGDGTTISRSSPVQIGALTTWLSVSAGRYLALAIKTDGSLWGVGGYGGFMGSAPTFTYRSSPVQVGNQTTDWASCSALYSGGFGIKTNGQLWVWGHNSSGVNGLNNALNQLSPIQVGALTTWSKIAGGYSHVLAIKTDGTLWSWGSNQEGRLGQNIATTTYRSSPVQVGALTTWSKIAASPNHSMAIKTDGTLWSWGKNDVGQLLLGDTIDRSSPVQVGALTTWLNLPDHLNHSLVTATPPAVPDAWGALYAVGFNSVGQLGQSDTINRSSPVQVGALTTWLSLFSGATNSAAIKNDGTLWTWGLGTDGVGGRGDTLNRSSPVQVGALTTWSSIDGTVSANGWAALATKTDGTLWSWGSSHNGISGQNDTISRSSPVQVGALTTWSKISVGQWKHTLAIKTDGTLWAWGGGDEGELGQNNTFDRSSPVQVGALTTWLNISAGYRTSHAIKTDGTLWAWGGNILGAPLGLNDTISRSSPVQVGALTTWSTISKSNYAVLAIKTDGTLWAWGLNDDGGLGQNDIIKRSSPTQVGALTTWSKADIGSVNSAIAIKTDGTLWAWGENRNGQLLLGDTINRSSPVQVGALTTWLNISAGRYATLATATPTPVPDAWGQLYAVGINEYGQLGQSDTIDRSSAVQVGALTTWLSLFAGATNSAAIKNDGTLWTWGAGTDGVGGRGDTLNRSSPVQVGALTTWLTVDGNDRHPFSGGLAAMAIKTDGSLWSWGAGADGVGGRGDTINRSSPVQVGALTTWSKISVGHAVPTHVLAVKTDGTLWSWGSGYAGAGGRGDTLNRSSPVQVGALTTWLNVAAGYWNGGAIKTDGTLWGFGYRYFGDLGLNDTTIGPSSPVQVGALTTWSTISKGTYHTMSIKTDGTLWGWGRNNNGQLGLNDTINRSSPVQVGALTTWSSVKCGTLYYTIAIKTNGTLWVWGNNVKGNLLLGNTTYLSSPVQVGALTTWLNVAAGRAFALATKTP